MPLHVQLYELNEYIFVLPFWQICLRTNSYADCWWWKPFRLIFARKIHSSKNSFPNENRLCTCQNHENGQSLPVEDQLTQPPKARLGRGVVPIGFPINNIISQGGWHWPAPRLCMYFQPFSISRKRPQNLGVFPCACTFIRKHPQILGPISWRWELSKRKSIPNWVGTVDLFCLFGKLEKLSKMKISPSYTVKTREKVRSCQSLLMSNSYR